MSDTITAKRVEPSLGEASPAAATAPAAAAPSPAAPAPESRPNSGAAPAAAATSAAPPPALDQISRIEDKTARIEEKFARSEDRMARVEASFERALDGLNQVAAHMDIPGLRRSVEEIERRVKRKPGYFGLFVVALLASLIGAAAAVAVMKFGIPGVLPR